MSMRLLWSLLADTQPEGTNRSPPKMGCAEGRSPFAGSLRVSLKYSFFSFLAKKKVEGTVERAFQPGF